MRRRAVSFQADMACLYRLHLQCSIALSAAEGNLPVLLATVATAYTTGIQQALDWERWLHPSMSFRVDVTGTAPGLSHSHLHSISRSRTPSWTAQRVLWGRTILH